MVVIVRIALLGLSGNGGLVLSVIVVVGAIAIVAVVVVRRVLAVGTLTLLMLPYIG